ncbi:hypothetical protein BCR32DRAFT_298755, partial [Anaeromyces robustus]
MKIKTRIITLAVCILIGGVLYYYFDKTIINNPAGLTATAEAYQTAKSIFKDDIAKNHKFPKIYLIEKEKNFGGNSAKATSGMNGALTKYQKELESKIHSNNSQKIHLNQV